MLSKLSENKLVIALVVPFVLWMVAKVSGLTVLPEKVEQHEQRITNHDREITGLRESKIRQEEQFSYIVKALERLEKREDRRR